MPGMHGGYRSQPKASLKAKGGIVKALKENGMYDITHIQNLMKNSYHLRQTWNGVDEDYAPFLNKPECYSALGEKAADTLYEKFDKVMREILMTIPEYVAEVKEKERKSGWVSDCRDLANTHYEYNFARYMYDSNVYQMDQKRAAWDGMISKFYSHTFKNQNSDFWAELYYILKNKENFHIETYGEEYISTYTHISTWSYYVKGFVMVRGRKISFDRVSYRDCDHHRV